MMPREPRCPSGWVDASKGDEVVPGSGTARRLCAAGAGLRRNPKGRAAFAACRCRSGLSHWSPDAPCPRSLACGQIRAVAAAGNHVGGSNGVLAFQMGPYGVSAAAHWARAFLKAPRPMRMGRQAVVK
jgi:hypothetical protein